MNNKYKILAFLAVMSLQSIASTESIKVVGSIESSEIDGSTSFEAGAGIAPHSDKPVLDTWQNLKAKSPNLKSEEKDHPHTKLTVTHSDRLTVLPDGRVRFLVRKATLKHNVTALLEHTGAMAWFPDEMPSSLRMPNSFYLYGDNPMFVLDQMVEPFVKEHGLHVEGYVNAILKFNIEK